MTNKPKAYTNAEICTSFLHWVSTLLSAVYIIAGFNPSVYEQPLWWAGLIAVVWAFWALVTPTRFGPRSKP